MRRAAWLLLAPCVAFGAGYPRSGGTLRVAAALPTLSADPTLADTPAEAALRALELAPACRPGERGSPKPDPLLARSFEEAERPELRVTFASHELALAQAQAWPAAGVTSSGAPSPYRSLLFPVRSVTVRDNQVELTTAFRWPDLASSLCHPALALRKSRLAGAGPYLGRGDAAVAQPAFAGGRPYPGRLEPRFGGERAVQRAFSLGEADVLLGGAPDSSATPATPPPGTPMLYATYLLFRPGATGPDFRKATESAIDRNDLTHYFVRGPASPLWSLLPPPLLPLDTTQPTATPALPPPVLGRPLELLFDDALPDQRAVAERLQVRLHDLGYRLSLRPLTRSVLRQRWAKGDFDLMLFAVLLPPEPAPALAVVLDIAGRRDLLPLELPPLGALDAPARAERVKARVAFFGPTLSLVPLYVQGVSVELGPSVRGLTWDGTGLPRLDALWLAP